MAQVTSRRRRTPPARARWMAIAGVAAASLTLVGTASAAAGHRYVSTNFSEGSKGYIEWNVSCNIDGTTWAPSFSAYMREFGVSGVKKLRIQYQFYAPGTGLDSFNYKGEAYHRVPGNWGDYSIKTETADTPGKNWWFQSPTKKFREQNITDDQLLVVKFTFDRGLLKKDTTVRQAVALCSYQTDPPPEPWGRPGN